MSIVISDLRSTSVADQRKNIEALLSLSKGEYTKELANYRIWQDGTKYKNAPQEDKKSVDDLIRQVGEKANVHTEDDKSSGSDQKGDEAKHDKKPTSGQNTTEGKEEAEGGEEHRESTQEEEQEEDEEEEDEDDTATDREDDVDEGQEPIQVQFERVRTYMNDNFRKGGSELTYERFAKQYIEKALKTLQSNTEVKSTPADESAGTIASVPGNKEEPEPDRSIAWALAVCAVCESKEHELLRGSEELNTQKGPEDAESSKSPNKNEPSAHGMIGFLHECWERIYKWLLRNPRPGKCDLSLPVPSGDTMPAEFKYWRDMSDLTSKHVQIVVGLNHELDALKQEIADLKDTTEDEKRQLEVTRAKLQSDLDGVTGYYTTKLEGMAKEHEKQFEIIEKLRVTVGDKDVTIAKLQSAVAEAQVALAASGDLKAELKAELDAMQTKIQAYENSETNRLEELKQAREQIGILTGKLKEKAELNELRSKILAYETSEVKMRQELKTAMADRAAALGNLIAATEAARKQKGVTDELQRTLDGLKTNLQQQKSSEDKWQQDLKQTREEMADMVKRLEEARSATATTQPRRDLKNTLAETAKIGTEAKALRRQVGIEASTVKQMLSSVVDCLRYGDGDEAGEMNITRVVYDLVGHVKSAETSTRLREIAKQLKLLRKTKSPPATNASSADTSSKLEGVLTKLSTAIDENTKAINAQTRKDANISQEPAKSKAPGGGGNGGDKGAASDSTGGDTKDTKDTSAALWCPREEQFCFPTEQGRMLTILPFEYARRKLSSAKPPADYAAIATNSHWVYYSAAAHLLHSARVGSPSSAVDDHIEKSMAMAHLLAWWSGARVATSTYGWRAADACLAGYTGLHAGSEDVWRLRPCEGMLAVYREPKSGSSNPSHAALPHNDDAPRMRPQEPLLLLLAMGAGLVIRTRLSAGTVCSVLRWDLQEERWDLQEEPGDSSLFVIDEAQSKGGEFVVLGENSFLLTAKALDEYFELEGCIQKDVTDGIDYNKFRAAQCCNGVFVDLLDYDTE